MGWGGEIPPYYSSFYGGRLLLSIDRRQNLPEASDTVKLAQEYALSSSALEQGKVVGIDLSGDPNVSLTNLIAVIMYILVFYKNLYSTKQERLVV